jgi:hypothetical protein
MPDSLIITGVWEAMELLNSMKDDSDPDVRSSFRLLDLTVDNLPE